MEAKIDTILLAIEKLSMRVRSLENKFMLFESRFQKIEHQLESNKEDIAKLTKKLDGLEPQVQFDELCSRVKYLEDVADKAKREALQQESYNKRLNLLIHGVEETEGSIWEKKSETQIKLNEFLKDGLKIDPITLPLADMHRLPQRPVIVRGKRINRPIIIKLTNAFDKNRILNNLKNLKTYNQQRQEEQTHSSKENSVQPTKWPVYITDHLPQAFLEQKKLLQYYRPLRKPENSGKKTSGLQKVVNTVYLLTIIECWVNQAAIILLKTQMAPNSLNFNKLIKCSNNKLYRPSFSTRPLACDNNALTTDLNDVWEISYVAV